MNVSSAQHHQIHGVQPVLPVADVDAAAAWFHELLGFDIEFKVGAPAFHARVKAGDGSWGAPVFIHLQRSAGPVQPCGETRLHVGHDGDALFDTLSARGAQVLLAPTTQTWGLREFVILGPEGHVLRFGAEAAPTPAHEWPRTVIVQYRPKAGQAQALLALVRGHVPALRRLGLATDRAPYVMQAADGSLIEVFEWASAAAIEEAHTHPEVQALWAAFGHACDYVPLNSLPEATQMFAEFSSL